MTDDPRVSVVLPTYDARDYLEPCIDSLCEQTFSDFEVVVVDGGSTDGTVDYVESIADERFRLVEQTSPSDGLPGALNQGISCARGEYVARQDADDISYPKRLEKQVAYLDANPAVALVGSATRLLTADGQIRNTRVPPQAPDFDTLLAKNRFVHGSVMFRRDTVQTLGGYDTGFEYTEDYDLWLRLATEHPLRNLQTPLYGLRLHDESIYGDQLRAVKLYGRFARKRVLGETEMTIDTVREEGVETVYESLSSAERVAFHAELAQELLRYGHLEQARTECHEGLSLDRTAPILWALLALSYTTPNVVDAVVGLYRRILNWKST